MVCRDSVGSGGQKRFSGGGSGGNKRYSGGSSGKRVSGGDLKVCAGGIDRK